MITFFTTVYYKVKNKLCLKDVKYEHIMNRIIERSIAKSMITAAGGGSRSTVSNNNGDSWAPTDFTKCRTLGVLTWDYPQRQNMSHDCTNLQTEIRASG